MELRFAVHARAPRLALTIAVGVVVALVGGAASAAPKGIEARAQYDRGLALYSAKDFDAAIEALAKSFALERDPETLFAWAQAERKLGRCDKAIDLYGQLLAMDLPDENKKAISGQLAECKALVGTTKPTAPTPPISDAHVEPAHRESRTAAPTTGDQDSADHESPLPSVTPPVAEGRPWYRDPIGDTLLGLGVAGVGVGAVFMVAGHSADHDKTTATTYAQYKSFADKASSDGQIGVAGLAAGGGLIVVSLIWYAVNRDHDKPVVTGWIAPSSGGFALAGRF